VMASQRSDAADIVFGGGDSWLRFADRARRMVRGARRQRLGIGDGAALFTTRMSTHGLDDSRNRRGHRRRFTDAPPLAQVIAARRKTPATPRRIPTPSPQSCTGGDDSTPRAGRY